MDIVLITHITLHIMFLALLLHYIIHFFVTNEKANNADDNIPQENKSSSVADSDERKLSKAEITSSFVGYGITRSRIADLEETSSSSSESSSTSKEEDSKTKKKKITKKKTTKKASRKTKSKRILLKKSPRKTSRKNEELENIFEKDKMGNAEMDILTETLQEDSIGVGKEDKLPLLVLKRPDMKMTKGKNPARHNSCMKESSVPSEDKEKAKKIKEKTSGKDVHDNAEKNKKKTVKGTKKENPK